MATLHPSAVLTGDTVRPVRLPVCDHYAGSEKLMRKALTLQAQRGPMFDITLDAEDGASAGREREHMELIASLLVSAENRYQRVGVRVHDLQHRALSTDLDTLLRLAGPCLAYVMFPKIGNVHEAQRALHLLNESTAKYDVARSIPAHFLIETHGALADVAAIAALPQVESLSFGLMDFVSAHRGVISDTGLRSPGQFTHPLIRRAKLEIAAACHAHGKVPSHNVTTEFRDPGQAQADATQAYQELGYTRMWSIHPGQIDAIITALTPPAPDILLACEILLAAQAQDWGPISHAGQLHDRASFRYYWELLQRAHQAGCPIPEPAAATFFKEVA